MTRAQGDLQAKLATAQKSWATQVRDLRDTLQQEQERQSEELAQVREKLTHEVETLEDEASSLKLHLKELEANSFKREEELTSKIAKLGAENESLKASLSALQAVKQKETAILSESNKDRQELQELITDCLNLQSVMNNCTSTVESLGVKSSILAAVKNSLTKERQLWGSLVKGSKQSASALCDSSIRVLELFAQALVSLNGESQARDDKYQAQVAQFVKLQAECRAAMEREEEALSKAELLAKEVQALSSQNQALSSQVQELHVKDEDMSKHVTLIERKLKSVDQALQESQAQLSARVAEFRQQVEGTFVRGRNAIT